MQQRRQEKAPRGVSPHFFRPNSLEKSAVLTPTPRLKFSGNKVRSHASHVKAALSFPQGETAGPEEKINTIQIKNTMKTHLFKLMGATAVALTLVTGAQAGSANGSASTIPAYYDGALFNIQFVEFSPAAEQSLLQHNKSLNFIYQSDPGLPGGKPFISVIDAIPGDGFNPIWEEVQITFTHGHTPRQLFSDTEVEAAFNAGEITLTFTGEVYWCPVVGPKPSR